MTEEITLAEYHRLKKNPPKYGNERPSEDGYMFDSLAELRRYRELRLLRQAGTITDLEVHPRYELLKAFTDRKGVRHRAIFYEADFAYTTEGRRCVEDVKGARTEAFRLKEKFFRYWYPQIDLIIVEV